MQPPAHAALHQAPIDRGDCNHPGETVRDCLQRLLGQCVMASQGAMHRALAGSDATPPAFQAPADEQPAIELSS
ncbi:MAG: hypothetical protein ACK515_05355 [bacterium]|jgi:hypothetical protein|nr:hypothetical protein [Betaproteobacteria bacterium]